MFDAIIKTMVAIAVALILSTTLAFAAEGTTDQGASASKNKKMAAWEGKVMTVTGLIAADQMGITLPHEHLLIRHQGPKVDLTNEALAIEELAWFKKAGGKTLVEMTNGGIGRDPAALKRISNATGIQIVMGSGYYKDKWQTAAVKKKSAEELAKDIIHDIVEGVDGVHAGVIGEVGVSRPKPTDFELKSLQAAAIAQKATGAAINIHFDYEFTFAQRNAALDMLEKAGADLTRVVVSHATPRLRDMDAFAAMVKRGCYIEFDNFGLEVEPGLARKLKGSDDPAATVKAMIGRGLLEKLLISQDVCLQVCYKKNGGHGYDNTLTNIVPKLKAGGISDSQIQTIIVENPARVFQFKNYGAASVADRGK